MCLQVTFLLNNDFLQVTDDDFRKAKAAFGQNSDLWIYLSTHDGLGNVSRIQINPTLKGAIQIAHSDNFGQNWDYFTMGKLLNATISKILYCDLNDGYIQRIHKSNGIIYDLHVGESEFCLYKSINNGINWTKVWDANITRS